MIGQTLAHYRVTAAIGAGRMGEVYRATDTKLGRDVAIKLLPEAFASDPERPARFEREARFLASLNHSNIAHLYGLEAATLDGTTAHLIAMELVEGEDLRDRPRDPGAAGAGGHQSSLVAGRRVGRLSDPHLDLTRRSAPRLRLRRDGPRRGLRPTLPGAGGEAPGVRGRRNEPRVGPAARRGSARE
jgi:hypothetical protein